MKNMKKLVALFAATAMACSMSISAFAAPTLSGDKATLTIGVTDASQAQLTMMAYVVPGIITDTAKAPDYTGAEGQEIVALNQEVGSTGFATVPVDAKKLADGNTIVVKIGGSAGKVDKYLITMAAPATTYSVTFELNGGTGTNPGTRTFTETDTIKDFFAKNVTAPTKAATSEYTYEFRGWSKTNNENGELINTESTDLMNTLLDGEATSVTLYALYTATSIPVKPQTIQFIWGDINNDGTVDDKDTSFLNMYSANGTKTFGDYTIGVVITGTSVIWGDINNDGTVDDKDTSFLNMYSANGTKTFGDFTIGLNATVSKTE